MKESLNRLRFALRFSIKNLMHHPMRSFLLFVGFLGLMTSLLLGLSMRHFMHAFFYGELKEQYGSTDLIITADSLGESRFFSTFKLNDPSLDTIVDDAIPFFEVDVLAETENSEKVYVHTYSSTLTEFKKISNQKEITRLTLNDNEILVTASFAKTYDLSKFDTLILYAGETNRSFQIAEIIPDGKLFNGLSVYLDKSVSLPFFLASINPAYADFPPSLLVNIHNTMYIDINDDISFNEAISSFKNISEFSNLTYVQAIDEGSVDQLVNRNVSVFSMIITMIIIAVLLVMQTTLLVYFEDKKKMFASITILGGKKSFSYSIILFEMLIYFIISFVASILVTNEIIDYGIKFINAPITYNIDLTYILLTLAIMLILFLVSTGYYFYKFEKQSTIQQAKDQGMEVNIKPSFLLKIFLFSLMLYLVLMLPYLDTYIDPYKSLVQLGLGFVVLFSLAFTLFSYLSILLSKRKKPLLLTYQIKMILSKKAFYQYTIVLLMSFMSLFLLILANDYMQIRASTYQNEYKLDIVVTNIIREYDQVYDEVNALDSVDHATKAGIYLNVDLVDYNENISELVSIDPTQIETYFNIGINQTSLQSLNNATTLKIILPSRFNYLYNIENGDYVSLKINDTYDNLSFEVIGFFDKQLGNLAFTNLENIPTYEEISNNAIFVNAKTDKELLKNELLDAYSNKMILIIDHEEAVDMLIHEMYRVTTYITYIISVIIFCFILSIINHSSLLLAQMKANYARIHVIGFSNIKMSVLLAKESVIQLFILLFSSLFSYVMIATRLDKIILIFGEYEPIQLTFSSMLYGSLFIFVLFIFIKFIYIYRLNRIDKTSIIKTFES